MERFSVSAVKKCAITEATSGAKVVKAVDLAHGGPTQFKPLLDRDLLASANWAELGVEASRIKVDGKWMAEGARAVGRLDAAERLADLVAKVAGI